MKIIGAGLSGLIAGALIPGSEIYERQGSLPNNHGAVLRFRSNKIARALNIPFKKVTVTKAIYMDHEFHQPNPQIQNLYSYKVTGKYGQRSIGNIDTVERYIAPPNFISQLGRMNTIHYNHQFPIGHEFNFNDPIISTIPLPIMLDAVDYPYDPEQLVFERHSIWTRKYLLDNVDTYQTIYFPGPETNLYRATITGDTLICEYAGEPESNSPSEALEAFGIFTSWGGPLQAKDNQKYGKIVDLDANTRRALLLQLTQGYHIYSLGRFATWRNILLDDVYEDIFKVMDLMKLDGYTRRLKI